MKVKVGVMGSAGGKMTPALRRKARRVGEALGRLGCVVVTGGCPGLPQEATLGAKTAGGMTLGISPALDLKEHVRRYGSPVKGIDALIFTGAGLMGREVTAVRTCDVVIIIGGRSGTLGEFAIAYDEGKVIGVLQGSGGIAGVIPYLLKRIHKKTRSRVVFDRNPERLVERLLAAYRGR
jgi:hypothetical protein